MENDKRIIAKFVAGTIILSTVGVVGIVQYCQREQKGSAVVIINNQVKIIDYVVLDKLEDGLHYLMKTAEETTLIPRQNILKIFSGKSAHDQAKTYLDVVGNNLVVYNTSDVNVKKRIKSNVFY